MRRLLLILPLAAVAAGFAIASADESSPSGRDDALLRSGTLRYTAFLEAESASLRSARRSGDRAAVRLYRGRLAPAGSRPSEVDPVAAVERAASLLSADARRLEDAVPLLDVEARTAGAALAFDAIRDALWAQDKGLTGSIDERLAGLRAELDRHRRGSRFRPASSLSVGDRRRLAAALDAYAWRLSLAADRVG